MSAFNDEILFIHIPKCAGTAVKQWLFENFDGMQGQDPRNPTETAQAAGIPIGHIPLRDIERYTGRKPESFKLIFAIVRDPYDQQLSQWLFWADRYRRSGRHVHDICAASHPTIDTWLQDPGCDFHLWYEDRFNPQEALVERAGPENGYAGFGGYYLYWISVNGEIPQNLKVVDYDRVAEDLPKMLASFKDGELAPLPFVNTGTARGPTQEYYTPDAALMVEQKFQWAFANLYQRWVWPGKPEVEQPRIAVTA